MKIEIRQGDVPLARVTSIPLSAVEIPRTNGKTILAFGEVTGHHHRFESSAAMMLHDTDGREYLRIANKPLQLRPVAIADREKCDVEMADGATVRLTKTDFAAAEQALRASKTITLRGALLVHEEHYAVVVAPGDYVLPGQREYTSADMEPIRVAD